MKPPRGLNPEEKALWSRVAKTVTPMAKRAAVAVDLPPMAKVGPAPRRIESMTPAEWTVGSALVGAKSRTATGLISTGHAHANSMAPGAATLDGGWDRRFRRGAIRPDRSIDLHGFTLNQAHSLLERAIADALADDVRVLLVVTGKEPKGARDHADDHYSTHYSTQGTPIRRRGIIRASIADWLNHSRHAPMIAAVRNAHPRDGGAGALYVILRRKR